MYRKWEASGRKLVTNYEDEGDEAITKIDVRG